MAFKCKLSFALVCLAGFVLATILVAMEILSMSASDWLLLKTDIGTYKFGIFSNAVTIAHSIIASTNRVSVSTMQAMAVVGTIFSIFGTAVLFLSAIQVRAFNHSPLFYFVVAIVFFFTSAILYLVGLSVYTNDFLHHNKLMFSSRIYIKSITYGYSYFIAWLVFAFQLMLALYLVAAYYFIKQKSQRDYDDEIAETERLVSEVKTAHEEAVAEAIATAAVVEAIEETAGPSGNDTMEVEVSLGDLSGR